MPNMAQPLRLIEAKGKKHLTKQEKQERSQMELQVPFTDVEAPEYLTAKQRKEFEKYAEMLLELKIMTELDVDCLVRYVLEQESYLAYRNDMVKAHRSNDDAAEERAERMADKAFKRAQSAARDLGLTISSRCKLVVPQPPPEDDEL